VPHRLGPDVETGRQHLTTSRAPDPDQQEAVDGGRTITRPTPIDEVPVWVRDEDWDRMRTTFAP
jgi:hypothetical protein